MSRWSHRTESLVEQLRAVADLALLVQLPSAGRSLIAAQDIAQGTAIHSELPMLAIPSPNDIQSTCYACLGSIPPPPATHVGTNQQSGAEPHNAEFCSDDCYQFATNEFLAIEEMCDFLRLRHACAEQNAKFPLLASRLACMTLQRQQQTSHTRMSSGHNNFDCTPSSNQATRYCRRGDAVHDMSDLCFVTGTMDNPPPEWIAMHQLLLEGLQTSGIASIPQKFNLSWYCWVLSRIHINAFRVDTIPLFGPSKHLVGGDRGRAMLRAASGVIGADSGMSTGLGSAVYLLASMLNHSCQPNVDVTFPGNDAMISFVAAMDVPKHTELCISYIDADMSTKARQERLQFAYGFTCTCPKCVHGE